MKYGLFEGYDHHNERSLWQVFGKDNDYQGVWHETKEEAIKELEAQLDLEQRDKVWATHNANRLLGPLEKMQLEKLGVVLRGLGLDSFEDLTAYIEGMNDENDRLKKELNQERRDYAHAMHILQRVESCLRTELRGSPTNNEEV